MNHRQGKMRTRSRTSAGILALSFIGFIGAALVSLVPSAALAAGGGLVLTPTMPILITLLIGFVLLVVPMNKMIFRPLFKVLDERAAKITGARDRAQHLEQEADASMNRYRDAVRDARENAEVTRQTQLSESRSEQASMTADAKGEAASEIARARGELEASLTEARVGLRASSEEVAKIAAEQILGRAL